LRGIVRRETDSDDEPTANRGDPSTARRVVGARAAAALIDFGIGVTVGTVLTLIGWVIVIASVDRPTAVAVITWSLLVVPFTPLVYYVWAEAAWGRTIGKRLFGLAVVDEDGEPQTPRQALVRNALRPVDFVGFYFVGSFLMYGSTNRQRLGDRLAKTLVVRSASADK
jgi:uncharacterized RDD family membrane protein YckC